MIEVSMGVDNAHHLQAQRIKARQDQLVIAAGVDYDGFFSDRVANDGAVALQRPDGEGFANQRLFFNSHGCPASSLARSKCSMV